uniref:Uncharacterized protein n=1 Tax=Iconisemion striatum TaxID=60296 RepID=A0A1A7YRW0_9TELE
MGDNLVFAGVYMALRNRVIANNRVLNGLLAACKRTECYLGEKGGVHRRKGGAASKGKEAPSHSQAVAKPP